MEKITMRSDNPECDWIEDFEHENGNYQCQCMNCNKIFYGHKRRAKCKICSAPLKKEEYTDLQLRLVSKVADDVFVYGKIQFEIKKSDWYGFIKSAFEIAFGQLPMNHNDLTDIILARIKIDLIIKEFDASELLID